MAEYIAQEIIDGLNMFFEIEITDETTVGTLLEEWLDITLSANEDCLHLAVYTPLDPDTVTEVL